MKPFHIPASKQSGRTVALQVLQASRAHDAFVQELLDRQLSRSPLSNAERRLATQLACGVLRRRGTLDALLRPLIARRPDQVESWLWDCLRLGTYQLALLTHIPAHAAVDETVELAGIIHKPRGKGFLNAVLRRVAGLLTDEYTDLPAADALPLEQGRYRKLTRPILPEPASKPIDYLASGFSWPAWLAQRWHERYGWYECLRLGFWFAGPGPLWLRTNTLRTTQAELLAALAGASIQAEPGTHEQAIRLHDPPPIRELPGFYEGWFTVQDESGMEVGSALAPTPGSSALDLCAAPGGKTTHLAELMHNEGRIVACDISQERLQTLTELCQRLGVKIVETCELKQNPFSLSLPRKQEGWGEPPQERFDFILVDAPCSNTGVLGRRPEVRWRLRPKDFESLVRLQTRLLIQAGERIRPGGVIVYSTCSIEPDENQQVVRNVLLALPDLELQAEQEQIPGQPADGGYWARLRRKCG